MASDAEGNARRASERGLNRRRRAWGLLPSALGALTLASALGACGGRSGDDEYSAIGGRLVGGRGGADDGADGGRSSTGGLPEPGGSGSGGASAGGAFPTTGGNESGVGGFGATSSGGAEGACLPHSQYDCASLDSFVAFEPSTSECLALSGDALCEFYSSQGGLFTALAECLSSCKGSLPSETICDTDSDCRLDSAGCCVACSPANVGDFVARNSRVYPPVCPPVACAPCLSPPELERNSDYFRATCEDRACTVTDITKSAFAYCDNSRECFLRDGTGCCEECDGSDYVPLSSLGFLGDECALVDCAACEGSPPPGLVAVCDSETQHCVKEEVLF